MKLSDAAEKYIAARRLARRSYQYTATRFARAVGDIDVTDLSPELFDQYRDWCRSQGLRPATIEGSIKELLTLHHEATGARLAPGRKLRVPRPQPVLASMDSISGVYTESPAWLRQYLALAYWSCLRIADCLRLQAALTPPWDVLRWTANKTQHAQAWPVPAWLQRHLVMSVVIPPGQPNHHLKRVLRREIQPPRGGRWDWFNGCHVFIP